jgi:hypothetical protein
MEWIEWFRREWRVLISAPLTFASALILGAALAFALTNYVYSGAVTAANAERDYYKTKLEDKPPPRVMTRTVSVNVPTPDPLQAATILELQKELAKAHADLALRSKAPPTKATPPSTPPVTQSGQGSLAGTFQAPITQTFQGPPPAPPARDPDSVYQLDEPVGTVVGYVPDLRNGTIDFDAIVNAKNLNVSADMEYRDWVIHCGQNPTKIGMSVTMSMAGVPTDAGYRNQRCKILRPRAK